MASATWPSLPRTPPGRAVFLRLLAQAARSARVAARSQVYGPLPPPAHSPAGLHSQPHFHHPGLDPVYHRRNTYAQFTTGPSPRTDSRWGTRIGHSLQERQGEPPGDTTATTTDITATGPATASSTARPVLDTGSMATGTSPTPRSSASTSCSGTGSPPAVTGALGQPLDPALVSQRKGRAGRTFSYIEGHVAISEANRVFGFGGWGYELVADVTLQGDRERRSPDRRGEALPRLQRPGAGHRARRSTPHRRRLPRRD